MSDEQKPLLAPQVTPVDPHLIGTVGSKATDSIPSSPPVLDVQQADNPTFFGRTPVHTVCTSCKNTIITNCEKRASSKTKLWTWICCLFFGLCCIPIICDWYPEYIHKCPICDAHIGTYPV